MAIWLRYVVVCSVLLNIEVDIAATAAAVATTGANTDACGLLKSCLNASDVNFAVCDKILDEYQPPCWKDMKSLVGQLRQSHLAEAALLSSCISAEPEPNDNLLAPKLTKQCQSMLGSYQHIASQSGWASRKKRDTSKDWTNFYKCINDAQRHHSICTQLSDCCPRQQKCSWQNALQPAHTSALQLKIQLFGVRQKCIATLDKDGQEQYDSWNMLGNQPIWNEE
uniref:Secreted protein n=1 Tax=Plectus sambesii TaxID=2011161 RepID=A0A914WJQ1_9BILA